MADFFTDDTGNQYLGKWLVECCGLTPQILWMNSFLMMSAAAA
jgi:hypothetical protein